MEVRSYPNRRKGGKAARVAVSKWSSPAIRSEGRDLFAQGESTVSREMASVPCSGGLISGRTLIGDHEKGRDSTSELKETDYEDGFPDRCPIDERCGNHMEQKWKRGTTFDGKKRKANTSWRVGFYEKPIRFSVEEDFVKKTRL